jgi:pyrroline-5-carboxylate reductase
MNNIRRLAFIGGGNMAAALIGGLTKRGLPSERVVVADPSQDQLDRLVRDYGVKTAADNVSAVPAPRW